GTNGRQSYDRPSLVPSGSIPFSLKVAEVTTDRQVSDGSTLRLAFQALLFKRATVNHKEDGPSGWQQPVTTT
ncbi:hypothetical protein HAX54_036564, partial [Datura stramonium]|nr:hypothetical protein [Datura stramonium]